MNIFDRTITRLSDNSVVIIGLHQIALLILAFNGFILLTLVPIFSFLFYPISVLSFEFAAIVILAVIVSVFGFGYIIVIDRNNFKLYEFHFFIPIRKLKCNLNQLVIKRRLEEVDTNTTKTTIECQDDPWAELGFSDWISIKKRKKEYQIGSNKNYDRIFRMIQESVRKLNTSNIRNDSRAI